MEHPSRYLTQMRETAPLIQNITNYVAMNIMANVMLAAGCSPAMVHSREEAAEFAERAKALTINIGTLNPDWVAPMCAAAEVMNAAGKPWVLDPVAAGGTSFRRATALKLAGLSPTVIRGNASEILAMVGQKSAGKGVDARDAVAGAEAGATELARQVGCVVAVTGEVDFITDGARHWRIANGHPLMPQVTALGCALNGIVAGFLVGQPDAGEATACALAYYGLAGEHAAQRAQGPGSFQMHFLDALHQMTPEMLDTGARIETA